MLVLDAREADDMERIVPPHHADLLLRLNSPLLVVAEAGGEGEETGLGENHHVVVEGVGQVTHAGFDLIGGVFVRQERVQI